MEGVNRKIESVNFFKDPIEPTWEFGDNASGGYYNFSLQKDTGAELMNKVYEILVFLALGAPLPVCDFMKGIRIVDTSSKNMFRCRF